MSALVSRGFLRSRSLCNSDGDALFSAALLYERSRNDAWVSRIEPVSEALTRPLFRRTSPSSWFSRRFTAWGKVPLPEDPQQDDMPAWETRNAKHLKKPHSKRAVSPSPWFSPRLVVGIGRHAVWFRRRLDFQTGFGKSQKNPPPETLRPLSPSSK